MKTDEHLRILRLLAVVICFLMALLALRAGHPDVANLCFLWSFCWFLLEYVSRVEKKIERFSAMRGGEE